MVHTNKSVDLPGTERDPGQRGPCLYLSVVDWLRTNHGCRSCSVELPEPCPDVLAILGWRGIVDLPTNLNGVLGQGDSVLVGSVPLYTRGHRITEPKDQLLESSWTDPAQTCRSARRSTACSSAAASRSRDPCPAPCRMPSSRPRTSPPWR